MPLFYHYTDDEGAQNIIRCGKIMASLAFMSGGNTVYGNGVYLTKLKPKTSTKTEVAKNNWMNSSEPFLKKTENCFVLDIPESEVKDTRARNRSIFLFGSQNDLSLHKYRWWLRNFDSGQIIVSYKYSVTSFGPAYPMYKFLLENYVMTDETVNGRPVFKGTCRRSNKQTNKQSRRDFYLYMSSDGKWSVSDTAGDIGWLVQESNYSLGPSSTMPWLYLDLRVDKTTGYDDDDVTLKVSAWQM